MFLLCVVGLFFNAILQANCEDQAFTIKCNNGQSIPGEQFCDGQKDCRDGSDETVLSCLHIRCPAFAFRCTYGACVSGMAECNGVPDCVDGSDETTLSCKGILESYGINGNCSGTHFQCKSGECIQEYNVCDGKNDCRDSSDETVELCTSLYCPAFAFQCGYGACVRGSGVCDGIIDCLDESDESFKTCSRENVPSIPTTEVATGTTTEKSSTVPRKGCHLDSIPNLKFVDISENNELMPGDAVAQYTNIKYKCASQYILEGASSNMCYEGAWIQSPPKCLKYCPYIPISGLTFSATCKYNGSETSCFQPLKPGTKATLSCKPGYRRPNRLVHDEIICDRHGEWDYSPYGCEPICGIVSPGGVSTSASPWNVAIYNFLYEQICEGTIINAKIILSAAHCFWEEKTKEQIDAIYFHVAIGKRKRDYFAHEAAGVQFFNLSEIYIPPEYVGPELFYQFDVAILVLNNFITFTDSIRPVCVEWLSSQQRTYESTVGKVAGWGRQDSSELQVFELNQIAYERCIEKTPVQFRKLVTNDKFCVDNRDREPSCKEHSGAGYITSKRIEGVETYFLSGIISNLLTNQSACDRSLCSTCTDIQAYANRIVEYETKYRPK